MIKPVLKNLLKLRLHIFLCILLGLVLTPLTIHAASLSGSKANAPATVNLSADSPADWIHWGYIPIELDRKAGVTKQITDYTPINHADPGSWDTMVSGYSWNDGLAPAGKVSNTHTGKRIFQVGKGFQFTVPASNTLKTLRVYVGSKAAKGTLTASLSDGSAAAYSTTVNPGTSSTSKVITLKFRAGSTGKKLFVKYVVAAKNLTTSFITLESAALEVNGGGGGATLTGTAATAPSTVNLTSVGSADWVHWGRISDTPWDRKRDISALISNLGTIGHDVSPSPANSDSAYSWSDGRPMLKVSGTRSGLRIFDRNKGIKFSAPADTTTKTLLVYVGLNGNASGVFTAKLSDSSAPVYSTGISQASGKNTIVVTLKYQAASNGQKLNVSFVRNNDRVKSSWLNIESAKLFQGSSSGGGGGGGATAPSAPPSGVAASDNTFTNKIAVSWNAVAGATRYDVYRSTAAGSNGSKIASPTSTAYDDTSAVAGTTYYYRAKACNSAGCSGFSSQDSGSRAGGTGGTGGALSGNPAIAPDNVNLSVEGPTDWAHWGLYSSSDVDRKAGIVSQISNISSIGGANGSRSDKVKSAYSWTGGSPTASVNKTTTGLRVFNVDKGFEFSVPASTTSRTLKVYVGAKNARGRLVASLSDKSAPDYTVAIDQPSGVTTRMITLKYKAKSNGQKLNVRYIVESKPDLTKGSITLESAALAGGGTTSNAAPVLNSIASMTITEGQQYSADVTAKDTDGPTPLKLSQTNTLPGSPSVLSDFGAGSGQLNWTSSVGDAAGSPYTVKVTATDGAGASSNTTAKITVLPAGGGGSGGLLSGQPSSSPAMVNLSTEGTTDWVHWGLTSKTDVDRKAGVSAKISNYKSIGNATAPQTNKTKTAYSWTKGTPTAKVSNTTTGLRIYNTGKGFELTAAAGTAKRTLKVYVAASAARGRFVASLSDGSAPDFVTFIDASSVLNKVISLTYRAASAGQKLTIRYVVESKPISTKGWIGLQSATLQADTGSTGGSLSGTFGDAPANVVLSNVGKRDWIHWGLTNADDVDGKAGITPQISNFTAVGGALAPRTNKTRTSYSWSSGEPTASVANTKTGVRVYNLGKGFEFTAPADTNPRTLNIYLDAKKVTGRLIASLSDGSSPEYTVAVGPSTSATSKVVTLSYQANSAGQKLKIRYVVDQKPDSTGFITLESAALR